MVDAAAAAGLDGVGITDHCTVTDREGLWNRSATYGFALDVTYERRRRGIERVREETDVEVYDGVEMDYFPASEDRIAAFLDEAAFDYTVGSVHAVDDRNVQVPPAFADDTAAERDRVVDRYFDNLVAMIESELFDVAAHLDVVERNHALRGRATRDHYGRVARALADSRTVPEVNAGRALREMEVVHPDPTFFDILREHDVRFTVGTDSHEPGEYAPRVDFLRSFFEEHGLEPVAPPSLGAKGV
jgi:histidinol-phosphatase (PHP family)